VTHIDTARERDDSRRSFLKKAAYTAPLILTLKADLACASYGSGKPVDEKPVKRRSRGKRNSLGKRNRRRVTTASAMDSIRRLRAIPVSTTG
jgi:hypothetical protein